MKKGKWLGVSLALAAAGLFVSNATLADNRGNGEEAKVGCMGVNACKGQSECKSAANACQGQNDCKGKGWVYTDSDGDCTSKGGTVVLPH